MADKSNAAQKKTLEYLLGISPSATVYLGLNTVAGDDAAAGTEVNAGVETNYARLAVSWNATHLVGGVYQTENAADLKFGAAVVGYTVVEEVVWDAPTGGNRIYHRAVTPQAIAVGNSYARSAGTFTIQER
jgi:hypothetical protein